ncbi:MAG: hypothetical protein IT416_04845 [Candidatus Pacebacteria bacterium]|nr:hypothetical protein [Candidatus Paceibacterota bacterium]
MKKFNKKQPITLVKLGGSIITNKKEFMSLKKEAINDLVKQIKLVISSFPNEHLIVGHGQGSYAHLPASKYRTMEGFVNQESTYGMAVVQDMAARLNREIVGAFIEQNIPAVSFLMSNSLITEKQKASQDFFILLEKYLEKGLFPITCGDVILDEMMGCTIWSTEKILTFFTEQLTAHGYQVERLIHITEVGGFLDDQNQIIKYINKTNWPSLSRHLTATKGVDVTGGMDLKVTESLALASNFGLKTYIMSGKNNNLYNFFAKKDWVGTEIS